MIFSALVKELGKILVTFLISSGVLFGIFAVSPGSQLGLLQAFFEYAQWLGRLVQGDFGTAKWGQEISLLVLSGFATSLTLIVLSLLVSVTFTVSFLYFVIKTGLGRLSNIIRWILYAISAVPVLIVAYTFFFFNPALKAPAQGRAGLHYYLVPALILGIGDCFLSEMIRHSEEELTNLLRQGYVRMAKARGASIWKHLWRDYAIETMQILSSRFILLLSGTVIIEEIFRLNGLGRLALYAASQRDVHLMLGISVFIVLVVCILNLASHSIVVILDPRLRTQK